MTWNIVGLVLAAALAAVAWRRAHARGGFYDADVYGLTPAAHRRYALVSLAFGVFFALTIVFHRPSAGVGGLALYALVAVFYITSFLRGAADYDE